MKHFHCPVNGYDCPYYVDEKILVGRKSLNIAYALWKILTLIVMISMLCMAIVKKKIIQTIRIKWRDKKAGNCPN